MSVMSIFQCVNFAEAGNRFALNGPFPDGTWLLVIEAADGHTCSFEESGLEAVRRRVDDWIAVNVTADAPGRFKGLRIEIWDGETHTVVERNYSTRGHLIPWFTDGRMPSFDEIIDRIEGAGDRVLAIRDNDGAVLIDRREQAISDIRELCQMLGVDPNI